MSDDQNKKPAKPYEPSFHRKESSQGRNLLIILLILVVVAVVAIKLSA